MKPRINDINLPCPIGTIYVCGACGRTAKRLIDFREASCSMNAVLCMDDDTLKYDDEGRVCEAVECHA